MLACLREFLTKNGGHAATLMGGMTTRMGNAPRSESFANPVISCKEYLIPNLPSKQKDKGYESFLRQRAPGS